MKGSRDIEEGEAIAGHGRAKVRSSIRRMGMVRWEVCLHGTEGWAVEKRLLGWNASFGWSFLFCPHLPAGLCANAVAVSPTRMRVQSRDWISLRPYGL